MPNLKIKVPRLGRNRLGVFYVRYQSFVDPQGRRRVVQKSLQTKDPALAKVLALRFCLDLSLVENPKNMQDPREGISPWTLNLSTGEVKAEGAEDTQDLLAAMAARPELFQALVDLQKQKAASQLVMTAASHLPSAGSSLVGKAVPYRCTVGQPARGEVTNKGGANPLARPGVRQHTKERKDRQCQSWFSRAKSSFSITI